MHEEDENFSIDDTSSFRTILMSMFVTSQVDELIKEEILAIAEEYEWNGEDYDEFKNETVWYENNVETIGYQAEGNVMEKVIQEVLQEMNVNIRRLDADLYETYEDIVKEEFKKLDKNEE
jgi:hypothetical protein